MVAIKVSNENPWFYFFDAIQSPRAVGISSIPAPPIVALTEFFYALSNIMIFK